MFKIGSQEITKLYIGNQEISKAYIGDILVYPSHKDYSTEYLTLNITSPGTIKWVASNTGSTKTIEYKLNEGGWTSITSNTGASAPTITVTTGDIIKFRGDNSAYNNNSFSGTTANFTLEGNIMSLINSKNYSTLTTLRSSANFVYLFSDCTGLTSAENLILPATTLTIGCYQSMFQGCTSLTAAPELPATTLTQSCYAQMFRKCTSLASAPELPATTLAQNCYNNMFFGCTSLTAAPELPATTLADNCYNRMFYGCTSLTTAPELPATTLANKCYYDMFDGCSSLNYIKCLATDISASNCTSDWVSGVASTGTFVKNSNMTSWTTGNDGIPNGWTVQDA